MAAVDYRSREHTGLEVFPNRAGVPASWRPGGAPRPFIYWIPSVYEISVLYDNNNIDNLVPAG